MSYVKQGWNNGDVITAEKLNHMEDGIETSLPEACQYNADHAIIITWGELCQLIRSTFVGTYPSDSNPWRNYFNFMTDNAFSIGMMPMVGEFLYQPVQEGPMYHLPYTMWFEVTSEQSADVYISICGYGAHIHSTITIESDADTETDEERIVVGEITHNSEAFWPVTQLIIEESEDAQGD